MNCKHVQELLPLYVGRDLEEKTAMLVTAHLQSCAECANSADEYRKTRQLLQQYAPPPFSDAVYAGIRRRVLHEIEQESTEQTQPHFVASLFRPRVRWAFATALLLAVCAFAFYFSTNRSNEPAQVANNPGMVDKATKDERQNSRSQNEKSAVSTLSSSDKGDGLRARVKGGQMEQPQQQKTRRAGVDQPRAQAVTTSDTGSMAVKVFPKDHTIVDLDVTGGDSPASSQKTLRMEIQTKDRNIRIIWFSHQPTKQDSSNESYKGI
jgi:hypothetical protein